MNEERKKNALLSVYRKTDPDIAEFAQELCLLGWQIWASGGTERYLREKEIPVSGVDSLVGGGAILGHRVVTLSRQVHAGLLARDCPEDWTELEKLGIPWFDLVCCDFYPLEEAITKPDATRESVIELTDIGGPTMVRSAAKGGRIVICDPADRETLIIFLKSDGIDLPTNYRAVKNLRDAFAAKAEAIVAKYCLASARFHSQGDFDGMVLRHVQRLAYAENRDQNPADFYTTNDCDPLAMNRFQVESGDPSYIAMADGSGMIEVLCLLAAAFRQWQGKVPFIAVVGKHANACGAAIDWQDPKIALLKALRGDLVAVMGGEVVTNFAITDELGRLLLSPPEGMDIGRKNWGLDLIVAPAISLESIALLGRREKRRLLSNPELLNPTLPKAEWVWKPVRGGWLRQKAPRFVLTPGTIVHWTNESLSDKNFENLLIAWAVTWRASSNTVALAKDGMLIALGCGQQDRIACVRLCLERANRSDYDTKGSVFASDAFFPYAKSEIDAAAVAEVILDIRRKMRIDFLVIEDGYWKDNLQHLLEVANMISAIDRREGPEFLIAAGCIGGVVPADGKNLEEVKALFHKAELSVGFVAPEHRGFARH